MTGYLVLFEIALLFLCKSYEKAFYRKNDSDTSLLKLNRILTILFLVITFFTQITLCEKILLIGSFLFARLLICANYADSFEFIPATLAMIVFGITAALTLFTSPALLHY
mgnify:CR=1 FL=1